MRVVRCVCIDCRDVGVDESETSSGARQMEDWSREASRRVGIETTEVWAERDDRRERKSLRNEVHNANAVVWEPV